MQQNHPTDEQNSPPIPFDADLRVLAVGAERGPWLGALIETARTDLRPRDFPERHLVDEMAINKWRLLRIYLMEKAVYEHQLSTYAPQFRLHPDGQPIETHEDMYHLAQAHAHDHDGIILAALSRLEARFHRQFYAALKMLLTLRRFQSRSTLSADSNSEPETIRVQKSHSPSSSSLDPTTTTSQSESKPNCSQ